MLEVPSVSTRVFSLVESRVCPSTKGEFKRELGEDETFETDFIGATEDDCTKWLLDNQYQVKFIQHDILVIADARSARDDTVLIKAFMHHNFDFDDFGLLPPTANTWNDFRVHYSGAVEVVVCLGYVSPDCVYPVYFGRKEELTDENGVFDVARSKRIIRGENNDTPQA